MNSQTGGDFQELAARIAAESNVRECALRPSGGKLRAYIVPEVRLPAEAFRARIAALDPRGGELLEVVLVSALPRDRDGGIDGAALDGLPSFGAREVAELEGALEAIDGVSEAAVIFEPAAATVPRIHLDDLAPKRAASALPPSGAATTATAEPPDSSPAVADGGPILDPRRDGTLLTFLDEAAASHEPGEIVFLSEDGAETRLSYRELLSEAARVRSGLQAAGVKRGDVVLIHVAENRSFVTALWGCIVSGAVPAPISAAGSGGASSSSARLRAAWKLLDHPLIVTEASVAPSLEKGASPSGEPSYRLASIERLSSYPEQDAPLAIEPADACLMLMTSGSTGIPKIVPLTHRNVVCRSLGHAQVNGFDRDSRLFNWFPMDHVGAVVMYHFLGLALNATQILAPTELILKQPLRWLDVLDRYGVTDTWAPNFAFGLVNDHAEEISRRHWNLSRLSTILNGGEAIVPDTAARFLELLRPHGLSPTAMLPAWGMSETSSGATCGRWVDCKPGEGEAFTCVGRPIPGVSLRVVGGDGAPAPMGSIGRVQIRGLSVFGGYHLNDEANRTAFTADGWFETGDLGVLTAHGLTITGRAKDVIIVNGVNFYCHEIEAVAEKAPGVDVSFTAACAVRSEGAESDQVAIFFHPVSGDPRERFEAVRAVRSAVAEELGLMPDFVLPVDRDDIPKTGIGKIERSTLRRRFERGELAELLRAVEREIGGPQTMQACFFERDWVRKKLETRVERPARQRCVLFADPGGLAERIQRELNRLEHETSCVPVKPDSGEGDERTLAFDPIRDAYVDLFERLPLSGPIDHVVHCWCFTAAEQEPSDEESLRRSLSRSVYSLLGIVQALAAIQGESQTVRLTVIANRTQVVKTADKSEPWKGAALGLLRSVALELPWLQCRWIDVDEAEVDFGALMAELQAGSGGPEIALRGPERWAPVFRDVDMTSSPVGAPPIVRGGVYMVTGGLGGLGRAVSRWLATEHDAKLVLIGRSSLDGRANSERTRDFEAIQELADAIYVAADVASAPAIQKAVAIARQRWARPIDGIFHLAGEGNLVEHWALLSERGATAATRAHFESMLRAKAYGTENLLRTVASNPETLFVTFSSANSLFGGATFGAYAAANAYLDACAAARRDNPRHFNFNWSMWDDMGMAEGNPDYARTATRQMGFLILSAQQALASMEGALARGRRSLLIGVDRSNPRLAPFFDVGSVPLEKPVAYVRIVDSGAGEAILQTVREVCRRSGCEEARRTPAVALGADGRIDRGRLAGIDRTPTVDRATVPQSSTELRLARIWKGVLNLPEVDVDANFFELGGDSLTAGRLLNRVETELGANVSIRALFENPTIQALAARIDAAASKPSHEPDSNMLPDVDGLSPEEAEELLAALAAFDRSNQ